MFTLELKQIKFIIETLRNNIHVILVAILELKILVLKKDILQIPFGRNYVSIYIIDNLNQSAITPINIKINIDVILN